LWRWSRPLAGAELIISGDTATGTRQLTGDCVLSFKGQYVVVTDTSFTTRLLDVQISGSECSELDQKIFEILRSQIGDEDSQTYVKKGKAFTTKDSTGDCDSYLLKK